MPVPVSVTQSTTYWPGLDVAEPAHIGVVEIGVGRLDGEAAAVRHGGLGVEREIEQHVLELMGVGKASATARRRARSRC